MTGPGVAWPAGTGTAARGRHWPLVLTTLVGLVLSGSLVWQASAASFTAVTVNAGNTFAAGDVVLADDDVGGAMLALSNMKPGSTITSCIEVTYQGSLAATVKLFVPPGDLRGTGLGAYLDLVVEEGGGGGAATCAGFTPAATLVSARLADFAAASTSSSTGVGGFGPASPGESRTYRFTVTLADDNAAQGLTATVDFTWEATSS